PLTPKIGAEIRGVDLRDNLDDETVAAIRNAWLEHAVVLFRDQDLGKDDQVRFTTQFGNVGILARPKQYRTSGHDDMPDGMMLISNVRENGEPIGALPDGEMMFHHDMLHADIPHTATLLYAVEIPSIGGNTLFASGYAAYDTLPEDVRAPLEGQKAFHHYNYGSVQKGDGKGTPAYSKSVHPVFRTHSETGRKAIYVNRLMTEGIVDMPTEQSSALLERLFDHSERAEFVYEHVWRTGDLLMWDNRCSMHARTDFPGGERRLLWRTTIASDERPY
ncbi:MAG: TauD/TfdA family dioxygenase, partial [Pseudomonadota bacterium]|nr:TauD/TfdA family dioxygenase [Pseudomonadota bacterium]